MSGGLRFKIVIGANYRRTFRWTFGSKNILSRSGRIKSLRNWRQAMIILLLSKLKEIFSFAFSEKIDVERVLLWLPNWCYCNWNGLRNRVVGCSKLNERLLDLHIYDTSHRPQLSFNTQIWNAVLLNYHKLRSFNEMSYTTSNYSWQNMQSVFRIQTFECFSMGK